MAAQCVQGVPLRDIRAFLHYASEGKTPRLVHPLNASGMAASRVLPAILEQCLQPDGTVSVPTVLRQWTGTDTLTA